MKKLLNSILSIQSESGFCDDMADFISAHCMKAKMEVLRDNRGNLYVIKGKSETYPCVVAHMDTVHPIHEKGAIVPVVIDGCVTGMNPFTMEQTGIGGDDKCGIYAAIRCLEKLPACKAVFFVDEEIGCVGSGDCDLSFFKDCRFVLQADRRGDSDWVTDISGPLGSDAFQDAVAPILKRYGYKPTSGMMSDVMALRDSKVGISVANMSAAYYNPHQSCEFIHLQSLYNVIGMMLEICKKLTDPYPFVWEAPARVYSGGWTYKSSTGSVRDAWLEEERFYKGASKLGYSETQIREMFPDYDPGKEAIHTECCMNCYDVFPLADMTQVAKHEYWCRMCHKEHAHHLNRVRCWPRRRKRR
jgi:hypothetical protein